MAGIRRVHRVEWFGYKDWDPNDGGPTFDDTPTSPWYSPDGVGSWWVSNNGVGSPDTDTSYIYMNSAATGSTYLVSDTKTTGQTRVSVDWAVDSGAPGVPGGFMSGIYFMAGSIALDNDSYRVKCDGSGPVWLEKMAGGAATTLGSFPYTPAEGPNFFRVRYYPYDYKIESDVTMSEVAGRFIMYAGSAYNSMTNIGSITDAAPIEVGSYNGLFVGANGSPDFYMYTYADDFWPLAQRLKTEHSLKGPSTAWLWTPKFYYEKWAAWSKGDYVQVFWSEDNGNEVVTEEYDFFGQYQVNRQFGKDSNILICHSPLELCTQHVADYGPYTGNSTGYLGEFLENPGGEAFDNLLTLFPRWVTKLNTRTGKVSLTARADSGLSDLDIMKRVSLVEDYYIWYAPEQRLFVTDTWRDMTSVWVDCGSWNSRFLDYDIVEDLTQTTTQANVYYDVGSVARYDNNIDTLGSRSGLHGLHVDLHIGDDTEAQAVGSTLVKRYGTNTYVLDCYFLARYTHLRPGDLISFSLPHLGIGGDYDTAHAAWVPITAAILEKDVDTETSAVRLRLNATWSDGGVTKGYQRDQHYFSDMLVKNYGKAISANANQL